MNPIIHEVIEIERVAGQLKGHTLDSDSVDSLKKVVNTLYGIRNEFMDEDNMKSARRVSLCIGELLLLVHQ